MEVSSPERVEMPTSFEDAPVDHLVQLIGTQRFLFWRDGFHSRKKSLLADMLQRLIAHNDRIPLSPYVFIYRVTLTFQCIQCLFFSSEALTRFHSRSAPGITVVDYLRRIVRFANVEVHFNLIFLCCQTLHA